MEENWTLWSRMPPEFLDAPIYYHSPTTFYHTPWEESNLINSDLNFQLKRILFLYKGLELPTPGNYWYSKQCKSPCNSCMHFGFFSKETDPQRRTKVSYSKTKKFFSLLEVEMTYRTWQVWLLTLNSFSSFLHLLIPFFLSEKVQV